MVFFTCGNCGESVKKPNIAKHYMTVCRGTPNVTCVDCLKDFRGNEYETHIKCITEEERYSAKGFIPKPTSNKGEKKQQSWCESMQSLLSSDRVLREDERELLTALSAHENVPRKKGKFLNFIGSAYRHYARRQELVERVWGIIEQTCKGPPTDINGSTPKTNGIQAQKESDNADENEEGKTKRKKNKKKSSENGNNDELTIENNDAGKDKKKSKRKEQDEIEEESIKKKKRKANQTEENGNDVYTVNGITKEKTKTDKTEGNQVEVDIEINKTNSEMETNIKDLITSAGGTIPLHSFMKGLGKLCSIDAKPEKVAKAMKKLQKNIIVRLH